MKSFPLYLLVLLITPFAALAQTTIAPSWQKQMNDFEQASQRQANNDYKVFRQMAMYDHNEQPASTKAVNDQNENFTKTTHHSSEVSNTSLFESDSIILVNESNYSATNILKELEQHNQQIVQAALKKEVAQRISLFNQNPICMPEHQVSMQGVDHLQKYYQTIFERQNLSKYERKTAKIYIINNRVIELGNFIKVGVNNADRTNFSHQGKFFNVWTVDEVGQLELAVETWNYNQHIKDIPFLLVDIPTAKDHGIFEVQKYLNAQQIAAIKEIQIGMRAGVSKRDGKLRATFYHDDAIFMPHNEPMMIGKAQILEHLIAYNSGDVIINKVDVGVNWSENLGNYILQSSNYYVEWQVDDHQGIGKGKGMRIWRKTPNGKQKILVQIALSDYME
ncbi:MAG: nuclear transport factor 2 family protein [Bacteroidota bacterium]